MATWAISVVGLIILTVLCDIILPEGETNKYIKSVIGIIAVLVLVSPLPSLINSEYSFNIGGDSETVQQYEDNEFLQYVCSSKSAELEKRIKLYLKEKDKGDCQVSVEYLYDSDSRKIYLNQVVVNLDKTVINSGSDNIYITEDVRKSLCEVFSINKEQVKVYV